MSEVIRIGTRRSRLALAQTELVVGRLRARSPETHFELRPMSTQGDQDRAATMDLDFTDAIDRALEQGELDLAVHSAKDLPSTSSRSVRIVAFPRRGDPRDCLVLRRRGSLRTLPAGASIGSSSARRRAQLLRARPDLDVVAIRGNVDTRIGLVRRGALAGVMLAMAGVQRLGRSEEIDEALDRRRFVPAPAQGALAVVARTGDRAMAALLRSLDDPTTRTTVTAERALVERLGGDCTVPLGALGSVRVGRLHLHAELLSADGARTVAARDSGDSRAPERLGRRLAETLLARGGDRLSSSAPSR